MRKLVSLWGYMRSHTSSSSANITMHWALEEHCRKTSSAPIPGDGECLDTEMWSALWLTTNMKVCGLRQQVVVHVSWVDQHAKRMFCFWLFFFFQSLNKNEGWTFWIEVFLCFCSSNSNTRLTMCSMRYFTLYAKDANGEYTLKCPPHILCN